jgi:hypothetical protein
MGIKRVSHGNVGATASGTGSIKPTKSFEVERVDGSAPAPAVFEPSPVSERIVESTRHLRGLVPDADLRAIQETLEDKLEEDPQFVDLLNQASSGKR